MKKHCQSFTTKYCKILLFTSIFVITIVGISSRPQTIDCRIHLYAPICRGVAAKRALLRPYYDGFRILAKRLAWDDQSPEYLEA